MFARDAEPRRLARGCPAGARHAHPTIPWVLLASPGLGLPENWGAAELGMPENAVVFLALLWLM